MAKLLRTIRRLRDPRDLWLFLQIVWLMASLPRRIRRNSIPDLLASLDPGVARRQPDKIKLEKTVGFVDSLLKYKPFQRYGRCLMRSLTLFKLLRLQGWPVSIHFGVRRSAEEDGSCQPVTHNIGEVSITGHSWLVLNKKPFLEVEQMQTYSTTFKYPSWNNAGI